MFKISGRQEFNKSRHINDILIFLPALYMACIVFIFCFYLQFQQHQHVALEGKYVLLNWLMMMKPCVCERVLCVCVALVLASVILAVMCSVCVCARTRACVCVPWRRGDCLIWPSGVPLARLITVCL